MRINQIVERILRDNPETRSNDRLLQIHVWEAEGFYLSQSQRDKFLNISSTETVRRTRQAIQARGLYKATEQVASVRRFKGMQMQQIMPQLKPDKIQQVIEYLPQRMEFS